MKIANQIKKIFRYIKEKQVPEPWGKLLLFICNIVIVLPLFIILHHQLIDLQWEMHLDRILLFLLMLIIVQWLLHFIKKIILIVCIFIFIGLLKGTIFRDYGFEDLAEDYEVMIYAMSENPQPQEVFLSRVLPFPNKTKILRSIEYRNPLVRNFALKATTQHFRQYKEHEERRRLVQSFAVFKEIQSRWNYVNDPRNRNYIATASESLQHFSGDCEDHAILMCASIKAIGGVTRLVLTKEHMYPELLVGDKSSFEWAVYMIKNELFAKEAEGYEIHYHFDEYGRYWLNLDYTADYPGGPLMSDEVYGVLVID